MPENNSLAILDTNKTVASIVEAVKSVPVMSEEDFKFLQEKTEHIQNVLTCTHMWRTDLQKESIINDIDFPTIHAKFHQAILEQKVQFDQTMYLAKDFENLKLDMELLECDLEDLAPIGENKRDDIKRRRIELDIKFKEYELGQMRIAMNYRMAEVKGWQAIEERLLETMRESGIPEEDIWNKNTGEIKSMFFTAINRLKGIISNTKDGSAEFNNIVSYAVHAYKIAKNAGLLEDLLAECNEIQLISIKFLKQFL